MAGPEGIPAPPESPLSAPVPPLEAPVSPLIHPGPAPAPEEMPPDPPVGTQSYRPYNEERKIPNIPMQGQFNRLAKRYPRIGDDKERGRVLESLGNHINDIASDPNGSDPSLYVSDFDMDFLSRLRNAAENGMESPWKGASHITHEETTPHWLPRRKKTSGIVRDSDGNPVVGYRIGYLNVSLFEAPVLYCSDGTLRMLIKHNYRRSSKTGPFIRMEDRRRTFQGYCRLPDPELLYPVRTRGTHTGVSYRHGQTNTIKTELQKRTGYSFK